MARQNWIWYGHAGHLIVAEWCRFHLNTYVNGYIVSTVGEYFPDRETRRCIKSEDVDIRFLKGDEYDRAYMKKYGFHEIGCDRKYETMVFAAKKCTCGCDEYVPAFSDDLDFKSYNDAKAATDGHNEMCERWDKAASPYQVRNSPDWFKAYEHIEKLKESGIIEDYELDELTKKLELKLLRGEM